VNYWKVIFATAVIFGAGVFTGGLLVNLLREGSSPVADQHVSPPTNSLVSVASPATNATPSVPRLPEVLSKPFLPKLDDQLHLSSEQHSNIEKIISNAQAQTRKLMQDTRGQIRDALTPDQRTRYDQLMKRPGSTKARNATTNAVDNLMWTNAPAVVPPAILKTNE
jgi:hypothetical protein